MSELQLIALNELHLALQAKMVPFAGFSMPLHYPSGIIAEHRHCREQAGFFDISHMGQCFIEGDDVAEQLESLTPAVVRKLELGQQRYTVLTNAEGGVVDDIIISRLEKSYMLVVNAACKEKDFSLLKDRFGERCYIASERALFALQGPTAIEVIQLLAPQAGHLKFMQIRPDRLGEIDCLISRSGYTGEDGFEISVAATDAHALAELLLSFAQVKAIGLGARDTLRLEAGLSLYGHELDESITPVEAGLGWLVDRSHDHFPGADRIHRQLLDGAGRKRVGLLVEGKIPVREKCQLYDGAGNVVGTTTSGGFSPTLNRPIALALIDSRCPEQTFYCKIRNRKITLRATTLPFVPHRYYRG